MTKTASTTPAGDSGQPMPAGVASPLSAARQPMPKCDAPGLWDEGCGPAETTKRAGSAFATGFSRIPAPTSLEPLATIYAMPRRLGECSAPVYGADVNHKRGRPRGIAPLGWCNIDKREIGYQGDPTDRADIRRRRQGRECCGRLGNSGATRTPPRIANDQPAAPVGRPSIRHPETAIGSLAAVKGARGQASREWPSMHARRRFVSTKRGRHTPA